MLFNKKASLEISIQAIVIVVLAMTLLGLGLGFIRGMFKNITSTTEDVTEQVRQKVLDDLITGDKKISFPKTEVTLGKGESTLLTVGIRNKKDQTLHYTIRFTPISDPKGNPFVADDWFQLAQVRGTSYILGPSESDVRNIRVSIPSTLGLESGSYVLTFDVLDDDISKVYAQKDFFIVIRS